MSKAENISGQKFGKLIPILMIGKDKHRNMQWLCNCDCGKTTITTTTKLKKGHTKSCGCHRREEISARSFKHGFSSRSLSRHPLYRVYHNMVQRCTNQKLKSYRNYGGRGISVCHRWLSDSKSFFDWAITNGWNDSLTIDRIDNNLGYSPSNCRFTTQSEQSLNTRNTVFLTYNEKTIPLQDWAKRVGLSRQTLYSRIKIYGWPLEKALLTPSMSPFGNYERRIK